MYSNCFAITRGTDALLGSSPRLEGGPSCEVDRIEGEEHLVHGDALVALQVDTALLPLHASIIKHKLFG